MRHIGPFSRLTHHLTIMKEFNVAMTQHDDVRNGVAFTAST